MNFATSPTPQTAQSRSIVSCVETENIMYLLKKLICRMGGMFVKAARREREGKLLLIMLSCEYFLICIS